MGVWEYVYFLVLLSVVSCVMCNAQARGRGGTLRHLRSGPGDKTGRGGGK